MAGKSAYEKYAGGVNKSTVLGAGAFSGITGGLLLNKDGSGTDRSTYLTMHNQMHGVAPKEEKFFTSPGGSGTHSSAQPTHGAVSALNLVGAGLSSAGMQSN